jgi:hypothetical protein
VRLYSEWLERNLRESLSQTGTAVIFHPARRIVVVPFLGGGLSQLFRVLLFLEQLERNPEPGITFRCPQDLGSSSALSLIKVRFARRPLTAEF